MNTFKLLCVEDSIELLKMIKKILGQNGYSQIMTATTCQEAITHFKSQKPDAIILDIMLPDGNGFSLIREFRQHSDVPVLILSACDADDDRLLGLGLGADDYLTKPFLPRELILRLNNILKRVYGNNQPASERDSLLLGDTLIDFSSGLVHSGKTEKSLTAKEFAILKKLSENRGNIVTADSICQAAWGDGYYGYENTLMVHIRRLREKIEKDPSHPQYLLTVRGMGYKLAKDS